MGVTVKSKTNEFDIHAASSEALVDMGGAADSVAKRNKDLSDDIKAELRSRVGSNLPKDETSTIVSDAYAAVIGKVSIKALPKAIDNSHVIKLIGQEAFNTMATISPALLKSVLAEADYNAVVPTEDGTRAVSFKELD